MPCFKLSVIQMHGPLPSSHTIIFWTSTATSVPYRYTRWVINADVGYDFDAPSDSWTELSVRAIALVSGQHRLESADVLGTVPDKIHTRITFCLSIVLGIHCLLYQPTSAGRAGEALDSRNNTFAFRDCDFAMPLAIPRRARQGTMLQGSSVRRTQRSFQRRSPRPQRPTRVH